MKKIAIKVTWNMEETRIEKEKEWEKKGEKIKYGIRNIKKENF
jgi:ribosome recycling factor